jgi:hypothetical protein
MTMGDDYAPYFLPFLQQVADIRDYQVNTEHLFPGKHKTNINDDDVIFIFHHHHVLADLTQPTEGNYF